MRSGWDLTARTEADEPSRDQEIFQQKNTRDSGLRRNDNADTNLKKMKTFKQFKKECFKNKEFRRAYKNSKLEFDIIKKLIEYRIENKFNRTQFSKSLGLSLYLLDKFMMNPESSRLSVIKKVTEGLGMKLILK